MKLTRTAVLGLATVLLAGSTAAAADPQPAPDRLTTSGSQAQATRAATAPAPEESRQRPSEATDENRARTSLVDALVDHGLSHEAAQQRVAQLNQRDLQTITPDQVQEAGSPPPNYIWTLLAVLLVVSIVAVIV